MNEYVAVGMPAVVTCRDCRYLLVMDRSGVVEVVVMMMVLGHGSCVDFVGAIDVPSCLATPPPLTLPGESVEMNEG